MNESGWTAAFSVGLRFRGDLPFFLKRAESDGVLIRTLREKTSVKDVIESCGVPHTEVDLILRDRIPLGFAHLLSSDASLEIYPVGWSPEAFAANRLQRREIVTFVVDGHLGKLARDLRLFGVDTVYRNDTDDRALADIAVAQQRGLLTRDRRLLMHAVIRDGYCPRSDRAEEQIVEVLRRFDLREAIRPYTRCLRCNAVLERVEKSAVMERLEPLTKIYYKDFRRCSGCGQIYWPGSHFDKLEARLERIRAAMEPHNSAGAPR